MAGMVLMIRIVSLQAFSQDGTSFSKKVCSISTLMMRELDLLSRTTRDGMTV